MLDAADALIESLDLGPGDPDPDRLASWVARLGRIDAVGHRIVHGGAEFTEPVVVNDAVRARLQSLTDLAPLHQPTSLASLDAVRRVLPGVPAVGCFDTAFHAGLPEHAALYALPEAWRSRWPLRRYGFHGLSHAYAARRTSALLGRGPAGDGPPLRLVSCHLGAGASLAAVVGGRCVDTTMGFTPLEGLIMATRSGSVDPGLVLWLQTHAGLPAAEIGEALEHRSGLEGLAGTSDMAAVLRRSEAGEARARLALDTYLHRLRALVAAMAAAMGGLDAITFTGGVGEHAPDLREQAAAGLGFLGIAIDPGRNRAGPPDREIGQPGAPIRALLVAAREDLEIAREVRSLLGGPRR